MVRVTSFRDDEHKVVAVSLFEETGDGDVPRTMNK